MKRGALIYDSEGAKRNVWFIENLTRKASKFNISLELVIADNGRIDIGDSVDFAIVRTICPSINETLERQGIRVFNNYRTSLIANDKWATYLCCRQLNIPVMHTASAGDTDEFDIFPCVMKSCDGHGGSEVFWAENSERIDEIRRYFVSRGKRYIVQQACDEVGVDMRVYMLGNEALAAVTRRNDKDFRSNYSIGGAVSLSQPDEAQLEIARKICKYLDCDYVGVDFIRHNGEWVLNEIEDSAGARMLYSLSDIDFCYRFLEHINKKLSD